MLVRCDTAVLGTGVVTWRMQGPAGCWCRISEVSDVGVGVVLTGGRRCDVADVEASVVAWRCDRVFGIC